MKRNIIFVMSILSILCHYTCFKDKKEQPNPLWSYNLSDRTDFRDFNQGTHKFYEYPISNNMLIVSGNKNKQYQFYGLDINTGQEKWQINHFFNSEISIHFPCIKDDCWYFGDGAFLYKINMITGQKDSIKIQKGKYVLATDVKVVGDYFFIADGTAEQSDYYGKKL